MTAPSAALDAWAILALLRDEPSAAIVERAVHEGSVCSWINLGEVLYLESRRLDVERALDAVARVADNVRAEVADAAAVQAAAAIKAAGLLSYADAFAVATAERYRVPLLTGDPEILGLNRTELQLTDLRSAAR